MMNVTRRRVFGLVAAGIVLALCGHAYLSTEAGSGGVYEDAYSRFTNSLPSLSKGADDKLIYEQRIGLAKVDPQRLGKHPIRELMERAERQLEAQNAKIASVTSLEDAVEDYKQAFGMDPPRGFDTW